jgi:hypothetical protein
MLHMVAAEMCDARIALPCIVCPAAPLPTVAT